MPQRLSSLLKLPHHSHSWIPVVAIVINIIVIIIIIIKYPDPVCAMNSGGIIPSHRVKEVLKECVEEKLEREVCGLEWQGKLRIGHFRVPLCLFFKTSLSAKPFI